MRKKLWWALGASAVVAGIVVLVVRVIHHPGPATGGESPVPPPGTSLAAPEEVSRAFASVGSYRADISFVSMLQGGSSGTFEYIRPDRRRWRIRFNGRQASDPSGALEVVRIGADTWFRTDGSWTRLPAGRKLQDTVPSGVWLPDLSELVARFFGGVPLPSFENTGSGTARAGACEVWTKVTRPQGPSFEEAVCVGTKDGLPYRISAGGPSVEAYMKIELYDYAAPVEIRPPQ